MRSGRPLKNILCRSSLEKKCCNNANCRLCGGKGGALCVEKDLVYKCVCRRCNAEYIGETGRPAATRFREHITGTEDSSAISQHHMREHAGHTIDFEMKKIARGGGYVKRHPRGIKHHPVWLTCTAKWLPRTGRHNTAGRPSHTLLLDYQPWAQIYC